MNYIIYYKTNWDNVNIHYKLDSQWSSLPGNKMTKISNNEFVFNITSDYSVEFCFNNGVDWDNNFNNNYSIFESGEYKFNYKPNEIKVLTLNLHTYQENKNLWDLQFNAIAKFIYENDIDIVAFQECAQHSNAEIINYNRYNSIIKKDNTADIIAKKIKSKYNLSYNYYWDWSHIGFDVWEEGSAILTKHNILKTESKYLSSDNSKYNFQSRNIVKSIININGLGNIEIYSVHFGWDKDNINQISNFDVWQNQNKEENIIATIFSGDFNNYPNSDFYKYITQKMNYSDEYIKVNLNGMFDKTMISINERIDYIFTKTSILKAKEVKRVFTGKDNIIVSDHYGLFAVFSI